MTLPIDLYPWFALGSSVAATLILAWHARHAVRWYARQPERAGPSLLISVVLVVCGVGLVVSAIGTFVEQQPHILPTIGLSLVRGALLTGAIVLFLLDRRR